MFRILNDVSALWTEKLTPSIRVEMTRHANHPSNRNSLKIPVDPNEPNVYSVFRKTSGLARSQSRHFVHLDQGVAGGGAGRCLVLDLAAIGSSIGPARGLCPPL
jgi:hypothetical protein